ncbi:hypothetical protein BN137_4037 [Cronobacter condimenti 1330]|uniref:Uncharacterized protein n=1 Tax=Cronobacter condimenti 1330 TaxID=1073999 RepID=K8AK68_9ENTR|nr:hypothetical protein BN137_4037 [Cronobacter condimenti 1330]
MNIHQKWFFVMTQPTRLAFPARLTRDALNSTDVTYSMPEQNTFSQEIPLFD